MGIPWTSNQLELLKKHYPHLQTKEVARLVNRKTTSVLNKANSLGLKKTLKFKQIEAKRLLKHGAKYRFKKGDKPANKGKKRQEFLTAEQIKKVEKTQFKKGHRPHNTKDRNGIISNREDKTGRIYKYIRLGEANWVPLHRHIWEQANGLIPENHIVIFLDDNTENTALENLRCISKAENMLRNSTHNYPEEIIPSMLLINQLENILNQNN